MRAGGNSESIIGCAPGDEPGDSQTCKQDLDCLVVELTGFVLAERVVQYDV